MYWMKGRPLHCRGVHQRKPEQENKDVSQGKLQFQARESNSPYSLSLILLAVSSKNLVLHHPDDVA